MKCTAQVVPATQEHVLELAPTMRQADREEMLASHGYSPLEALEGAVAVSDKSWAILIGGKVACLFGIAKDPNRTDAASLWLLTGEVVNQRPLPFLAACRTEILRLLPVFPILFNAIDARHWQALKWARWLGFEVHDAVPFGVAGLPFHPIVLRA